MTFLLLTYFCVAKTSYSVTKITNTQKLQIQFGPYLPETFSSDDNNLIILDLCLL